MAHEILVERLFEALVNGDRPASRSIVDEAIRDGAGPALVMTNLFWPTHELIDRLHRSDQLGRIGYHFSTRILRVLVDQTAGRLLRQASNGKTVFACCGTAEGEELGAQIAVDLIEAGGFRVTFGGGGIPADEILAHVQTHQPSYLVMFCSAAADLPGVRQLVDTLRDINACQKTQLAVGGGVFNRAEGLADEIGAKLHAPSPLELVQLLLNPDQYLSQRAENEKREATRAILARAEAKAAMKKRRAA
jgi:methanogenic corrinoid protein MtbC1